MLNGKHDPAPDGGGINHLFAPFHGIPNILNGSFRGDREWSGSLSGLEHFCFHKAGFDGQYVDAMTRKTVAQCFKISGQPSLRGIVTGVAYPAAVRSDR